MEGGAEVLVICRRVGISQREQVKFGGIELELTLSRGAGLLPEIAEVHGVGVTRAWEIAVGGNPDDKPCCNYSHCLFIGILQVLTSDVSFWLRPIIPFTPIVIDSVVGGPLDAVRVIYYERLPLQSAVQHVKPVKLE